VVAEARDRFTGRISVADLVGLLVSCLLVVVVFSPVLFFGHTLSTASATAGTNGLAPSAGAPAYVERGDFRPDPGASAWQSEPWAEVTHRAYDDGEVPLWNPFQGSGAPLAANMISEVFDPLLLAVNLHPTPLTWDLTLIGAFLLGAAAAFGFGRVLGLHPLPAVVCSAAFSLSGWFFLYSNNPFSRSYLFLPLLFLLVELVLRSRGLFPVLGLSLAIAGNLYVGMPESSALVIGSTAFYAIARLIQERRQMPLRVSLVRLSGAALLGVMLAAPLVLLFLQYEPLSFNIHKPGGGKGSETDPQWGLLNWLVPYFQATGRSGTVRNWIGVAVGVSTLVAISGRSETRRLRAWLFVALAAAVLLKIYEFRVFAWVGRLPVVEQIVFPTFAAPIASFAFAVLAGIGVQVALRRDVRLRRFLILLGSSAVLLLIFMRTGDRWSVITSASGAHLAAYWGRGVFFAALAIAAVILAAWSRRRWPALLLAMLIVAELFALAPFSIYAKRADPFRTPGWMRYVRTALGTESHARVFGLDAKLYPNSAGALGLQDIRALDALYVERYLRYVRTFLAPTVYDRFTGTELPVLFRDNPMFDALSVRAVVSQQELAVSPALRFIGADRGTRVYENMNAYPRAWVVHDVHVVGGEDDAFRYLQARARRKQGAFVVNEFDPRSQAVVELRTANTDTTLDVVQDGRTQCSEAAREGARIQHYSANSVTVHVEAKCAGLLVLSDTYFPGWTATVNGETGTIYATDGAFRGVIVPRGESRVEFRYEPRVFRIGLAVAIGGVVVFLVVAVVSLRRRRPGGAHRDADRGCVSTAES
jgi:hypothetical protein